MGLVVRPGIYPRQDPYRILSPQASPEGIPVGFHVFQTFPILVGGLYGQLLPPFASVPGKNFRLSRDKVRQCQSLKNGGPVPG